MATRLINNLGEGSPSSCVISVGCSYWSEHRALVLNSSRQTFWRLAGESCGTTNIWLFPEWPTAVRIDRRQDLTSSYFQVIYVANVCAVLVYM